MSIGYACRTATGYHHDMRTCRKKNATPARLAELIGYNLGSLERMIDYNIENGIRLYRISSDLVPFGSAPVNTLDWGALFAADWQRIGEKIARGGIRVSMHPGQYTVLNSLDEGVAARAAEDLAYHARVLDLLQTGISHRIVLHVGGAYGDRTRAMDRFARRFRALEPTVRRRIVLENDDRIYHVAEVLGLGEKLGIPVVFDALHHRLNPPAEDPGALEWITRCARAWGPADGRQKIHYSQQEPGRRDGSHTRTIRVTPFLAFWETLGSDPPDCMLEVKDKNVSALKCIHCTDPPFPGALRRDVARWDWAAGERGGRPALPAGESPAEAIRFYQTLEETLEAPVQAALAARIAEEIWETRLAAGAPEKGPAFHMNLTEYREDRISREKLKRWLYREAVRQDRHDMLDSGYFWDVV